MQQLTIPFPQMLHGQLQHDGPPLLGGPNNNTARWWLLWLSIGGVVVVVLVVTAFVKVAVVSRSAF